MLVLTYMRKRKSHSLDTRAKIAASNTGKQFSRERCEAIRQGKVEATKLSKAEEDEFKRLTMLGYVPAAEIQRVMNLKRKRFLRFVREYKLTMPIAFLPSDMTEAEGRLILEMAQARVHFNKIANVTGRLVKQVRGVIEKFEERYNFKYSYDRTPSQGETRPERFVRQMLEKLGVEFTPQFGIDQLLYDFHITGTSLLIEVQGDFWHANPRVYPNGPVYHSQKSNVLRDNFKRRKARDNGYWVWYVWEYDIVTEPRRVEDELRQRISRALNYNQLIF